MKPYERRTITRQAPWNRILYASAGKVKQDPDCVTLEPKTNKYGLVCPMPAEQWPEWAEWMAIDGDGEAWYYKQRPYNDHGFWYADGAKKMHSIKIVQGDWRQNIWHRNQA